MSNKETGTVFRNPETKQLLTKALFLETSTPEERHLVRYTTRDSDVGNIPSIVRLFLECEDPTEYDFANKYFEGWTHWDKVRRSAYFSQTYENMKLQLELKLQARALRNIMFEAEDGGRNAYQANKYLVEKGYRPKETSHGKRGRPSKDELKTQLEKAAAVEQQIKDDHERLKIN